MALELVTGGDVTDLVSRRGGLLPVPVALRLLVGCCEGLAAVAEAGFIHRDIKPSNIFLTEKGQPKLADLGLASSLQHDGTNEALAHRGTPAYMSPEQARGDELDIRSDLYSLGATLYYMVTGRPPFQGTDPIEVVQAVLEREAPDPRSAVPGLNEDLGYGHLSGDLNSAVIAEKWGTLW
jgi:serine/threonine protein kinase